MERSFLSKQSNFGNNKTDENMIPPKASSFSNIDNSEFVFIEKVSAGKKILVFDMNGVMIFKKNEIPSILSDQNSALIPVKDRFLSPFVYQLKDFLKSHDSKVVLWSTMMSYNLAKYQGIIEYALGRSFDYVFSQENCDDGNYETDVRTSKSKKDLRKVAQHFKISLDSCVLIDDSFSKRVEKQNFILFKYDSKRIAKIFKTLHQFVDCKSSKCKYYS